MNDAMVRLQKARTGVVCASPFFAILALRLDMKIDEKAQHGFWVDGVTMGVHPKVALELPMDELEGIIARAVTHSALGHPMRREGREAEGWNSACAEAAGHEVLGSGFKLPSVAMPAPDTKGQTAEQVYASRKAEEQDKGEGKQAPDSGQQAPGQGKGTGEGAESQEGAEPQGPTPSPEASGTPSEGGSGLGEASPAPSGEVRDAPADSEAQAEELANEWQEAVAQAVQMAKAAGQMPGSLERAAMRFVHPQVDWRECLARFLKATAKDDHSWTTPNKRFLGQSFILPGMKSERAGDIAVAIDMSGSVQQHQVDAFASELAALCDEIRPERVIVMPFDTQVREVIMIEEGDDVDFRARAGGGTDFRCFIHQLEQDAVQPEALVVLTDLECSNFADEPSYPVLWIKTGSRGSVPPYGEVIEMLV